VTVVATPTPFPAPARGSLGSGNEQRLVLVRNRVLGTFARKPPFSGLSVGSYSSPSPCTRSGDSFTLFSGAAGLRARKARRPGWAAYSVVSGVALMESVRSTSQAASARQPVVGAGRGQRAHVTRGRVPPAHLLTMSTQQQVRADEPVESLVGELGVHRGEY